MLFHGGLRGLEGPREVEALRLQVVLEALLDDLQLVVRGRHVLDDVRDLRDREAVRKGPVIRLEVMYVMASTVWRDGRKMQLDPGRCWSCPR